MNPPLTSFCAVKKLPDLFRWHFSLPEAQGGGSWKPPAEKMPIERSLMAGAS